jgi:circadian clock protein KaiB
MPDARYRLRIYVAGERGASRTAVQNLKKICDEECPGRYKIEVVDVSKNPRAAVQNNLTALPLVIRTLPAPIRKFVGNWTDENRQLVGFGLITEDAGKNTRRTSSREPAPRTKTLPRR